MRSRILHRGDISDTKIRIYSEIPCKKNAILRNFCYFLTDGGPLSEDDAMGVGVVAEVITVEEGGDYSTTR